MIVTNEILNFQHAIKINEDSMLSKPSVEVTFSVKVKVKVTIEEVTKGGEEV
jgi:hypothetical protein